MADFAKMERCQSLPQPKKKQKVFRRSVSFSLPKSPSFPQSTREHEAQEATVKRLSIQESLCSKRLALQTKQDKVNESPAKERKLSPGSFSLKNQSCAFVDSCECDLCKAIKFCIVAKSKLHEKGCSNAMLSKLPSSCLAVDNVMTEKNMSQTEVPLEEILPSAPQISSVEESIPPKTSPPPPPPPPPPPVPPLPPTITIPQKPAVEPLDIQQLASSEGQQSSVLSIGDLSSYVADIDEDYDDEWNELCVVCYCTLPISDKTSISCSVCLQHICSECMQLHLTAKIMEGFVLLKCPGELCSRVLTDEEVSLYCSELLNLYIKNKVDAENNPKRKTCPGCNIVHNFEGPDEIPLHHKCSFCGLQWCVPCHAPWHIGMTCKTYKKDVVGKGQKALKVWAKGKGKDSANARKCPKCNFFIERISGCDHMVCSRYMPNFVF